MPKPNKKELAAYYRETFGFDPEALSAEQKADLRAGLAKIKSDKQIKVPASAARALSLWQHFEAGEHPGLVDAELARKAGVPRDQIERINAERSAAFQERATSAHAARAVPDPELKSLPDLQLPPANVDPVTGLRFDKVYPSPDGSLPPKSEEQRFVERDGVKIPLPTASEKSAFEAWAKRNGVNEPFHPDHHYDNVGAFRAGIDRNAESAHFPDTFKLPGHPTFSDESQYAVGDNAAKAGHWDGDTFIPPVRTFPQSLPDLQLPPENIDPKTGLDFTKVYPGPGGTLPPAPTNQEDEMDFTREGGT